MFVCVLLTLISTVSHARSLQCPTFTHEQDILIRKAHAIGGTYDLGYTLAAITWKESIVGKYIIRINPTDGSLGSYGVSHVLLTTAMELVGETNRWRARSVLAPRLIQDDVFALKTSLKRLLSHQNLGWRTMIRKYNGRGPKAEAYMRDVVRRVGILQTCLDRRWG